MAPAALDQEPAEQMAHADDDAADHNPASQVTHVLPVVAPEAVENVPAAHGRQAELLEAEAEGE